MCVDCADALVGRSHRDVLYILCLTLPFLSMFGIAAEYEVDFITYFTKLAGLGATFDNNKYLYPITLELPKIK